MTNTIISIKPIDTLFFKDGKPFSMGDDTWAEGIFPPAPSTIYGALRTLYFSENPSELSKIKNNDPTENLVIEKIYLKKDKESDSFLFPQPLDLVSIENSKYLTLLKNLSIEGFYSSQKKLKNLLSIEDKKIVEKDTNFINKNDITNYLKNTIRQIEPTSIFSFITKEAKTGIAINNETNAIDEGKLYRIGMNRLKDISFVVEFSGIKFEENFFDKPKIIKLGAEGKTAFCEKIKETKFNQYSSTTNRIKMYLSTPAIFENGWIPDFIDKEKMIGNLKILGEDLELTLKTAVIGKPIMIGGFDMLNNKPKVMRKTVPAGSVYYFTLDKNISFNHLTSFSICDNEYKKQGFGIVFLGDCS